MSCGQCAAVCPTAALTIKSETDIAWAALNDPGKVVIAQIAPAVRVAIGEMFGAKPGEINLGKLVSALRLLGFDKVFDTSFTADLTIMEETNEFVERFKSLKSCLSLLRAALLGSSTWSSSIRSF